MPEFEGHAVLVTGGSSGIGLACAMALARAGAAVAVVDLDRKGGEEVVRQIESGGGRAIFVEADVADETSVQSAIRKTVESFRRLDGAVNSAGIAAAFMPLGNYDTTTFDKVIAVNLRGVFLCMKHEINQMLRQKRGSIVNISSAAGLVGIGSNSAYTASKHDVVGLTKSAAIEYARAGIRINSICPGVTRTPIIAKVAAGTPDFERINARRRAIGRIAEPGEIADVALWLLSPRSSFVTGAAVPVDGGFTAGPFFPQDDE